MPVDEEKEEVIYAYIEMFQATLKGLTILTYPTIGDSTAPLQLAGSSILSYLPPPSITAAPFTPALTSSIQKRTQFDDYSVKKLKASETSAWENSLWKKLTEGAT